MRESIKEAVTSTVNDMLDADLKVNSIQNEEKICSCRECDLPAWKEYDKCVLHCPKGTYQSNRHDNTLSEFYDELKQYIVNQKKKEVIELHKHSNEYSDSIILNNVVKKLETNKQLQDIFQKNIFVPKQIIFPHRDSRDSFNYLKLLNYFGQIDFKYCEFYAGYLELPSTEVFFQDCSFHNSWGLYDYKVLENIDNVIYQTCHFKNDITMYNSEEEDKEVKLICSQFDYTCTFSKNLELTGIEIEEPLFNTNQTTNYLEDNKVQSMYFIGCTFKHKFILNNYTVDNFKIKKCLFEDKLEFKKNSILKFEIDDSNFVGLVFFYKTNFREFIIYKSIFKDFVGFEHCEFGTYSVAEKSIAIFRYVTFLDFTNFRNTKFKSGLDIENINLKEYPNFLNIQIDEFNTNRETFRVLKHSFDKNGNYLEGNKYFSLEMKKYGEELYLSPLKGHVQEKLVFWVNENVSNFGQSWGRPVAWIILFIIIYGLIIYGNEHDWLMSISLKGSEILNTIVHWLNYPLKEFKPLEKILKKDYEFISLIFNIIFSVLIWQTIVAVKRHTKR